MPAEILGVGEVLWDLLPTGRLLGGAPCNFVFHCRQLGHSSALISRLGSDALGQEARAELQRLGLTTDLVQVEEQWPTGTVSVDLRDGQPTYTIHENVAWDHLAYSAEVEAALAHARVLCFGTLMQRHPVSRAAVQRLVKQAAIQALVVCDINLRQDYYSPEVLETSLLMSRWAKLNEDELGVLRELFGLHGQTTSARLASLRKHFRLELVALTLGERGCLVQSDDEEVSVSGERVQVVDTIGAGDAFTAGLVCGVLEGLEVSDAARLANRLAARVTTARGGTPLIARQELGL